MEISLRKANKIQTTINDVVKSIPLTSTVSISEFHNHKKVIEDATTTLTANIERVIALNAAMAELRHSVGVKNSTSQINTLLTTIAHIEKNITLFTGLSNCYVALDEAVIVGKLEKIRQRTDDSHMSYGRSDDVTTSIMTQTQIDKARETIAVNKKSKQKIQDQILELNISTKITLSDTTIAVLASENLL